MPETLCFLNEKMNIFSSNINNIRKKKGIISLPPSLSLIPQFKTGSYQKCLFCVPFGKLIPQLNQISKKKCVYKSKNIKLRVNTIINE